MHTGAISFCDRIHFNVKSSDTKDALLQRLDAYYQLKIIARHWTRMDAAAAKHIVHHKHWLNLRSNGNPYYMVLTMYEGVETIFFVDKKVQPGYQYPRMILTKGRFAPHLFQDTVLDGEMVRDTAGHGASPNGWVFLINDVIAYAGKSVRHLTLAERLARAVDLLAHEHTPDPFMDTCLFHIKRYYAATQEGFTALLEAAADWPYTQRGVYVWPDRLGPNVKPKLFNFDEGLIKEVVRKVKDEAIFRMASAEGGRNPLPKASAEGGHNPLPKASAEGGRNPLASAEGGRNPLRMWLRKTENPDVYDVYAGADAAAAKVGIAGVPSLATSKMLRAAFKTRNVATSLAFDCIFNDRFQKWVPT